MKSFTQRWREASDEAKDQPMEDTPTDPKEAPAINTHVRLFDLVRYLRSELHRDGLITDEEYAWLVAEAPMATSSKGGSPSRQRLEDYDELRAAVAAQTERADRLQADKDLTDLAFQSAIQDRDRLREENDRLQAEVERQANKITGWVNCPVCGESDMMRTEDSEGCPLIFCVNHACRSNGGTNDSAITQEALEAEKTKRKETAKDFETAFRLVREENTRLTAELDAVRKERDCLRATFDQLGVDFHELSDELSAAQAKCAELEKLIQDAPHGMECPAGCHPFNRVAGKEYLCICWKSRQASAWQSIETAPKDGTPFLACVVIDANMEDRADLAIAVACYDTALGCFGLIDATGNGYLVDETFYYWQPLPAPPEEKRP